ncbi:hypothetical protein MKW92_012383 [Papaver armeniacum]|nr:hypothetical protein MKW92_012383 [Papaver armeniacum]
MSKTLLSLIKPKHNQSSHILQPISPNLKRLLHDVLHILQTHQKWEEILENQFSGEVVSEVAPLVLDRIHNVEKGLKFFDFISRWGSLNSQCYSSLLKILVKSKRFKEIETVLENTRNDKFLLTHEVLNDLIRVYSVFGMVDKALEMYDVLVNEYSSFPTVFACNGLLDALFRRQGVSGVDSARQVYDEMLKRNECGNNFVDDYSTGIMVKGLCREGMVEEGKRLIEDRWGKDCIPNIVFYNTLIDGYCRKGEVKRGCELFEELKLKGFVPTLFTYGAMIKGLCSEGDFEQIDEIMSEMHANGLSGGVEIYNNIIDSRFRHGFGVQAVDCLNKMIEGNCEPDITTYNIVISGLCKVGKVHEANGFLGQAVERRLRPDKYSYTPLILGYCRKGEVFRASNLIIEMTQRGDKPDLVTYGALVSGLVHVGEVDAALRIREEMIHRGLPPDVGIYNVLMSGLSKKGMLHTAKQLLEEMLNQKIAPDSFVYTTLIDGSVRNGDLDEAKKLFEFMVEKGIKPGVVGYNAMIKGFCKFGLMEDANLCIDRMVKRYVFPDKITYSTVIDGYVKQHDMDGALKVFNQMVKRKCKPNVVTYTSLIKGGKLSKSALCFEEMLINNCAPNDVTYNYLINGLVNNKSDLIVVEENEFQNNTKVLLLDAFGMMVLDRWDPSLAAYNAIVVCLCRHRMLKSAFELRDKMTKKGFLLDSVNFAAILHGICLEGRSSEWKSFYTSSFDQRNLQVALRYSELLDKYLLGKTVSEASQILRSLSDKAKTDNPSGSIKLLNDVRLSVM